MVDAATFRTVQPHYTAAPIFIDGHDPLPMRSGHMVREGDHVVLPEIPDEVFERHVASGHGPLADVKGYEAKLARLGDGEGLDGFHNVLIAAVASYCTGIGADLDRDTLKTDLQQRINEAPQYDHRDTSRYRSDRYLDDIISSALRRFGQKEKTQSRIAPTYPAGKHLPISNAREAVNQQAD